jgi:multiple sugar transport system substrate-binding protein
MIIPNREYTRFVLKGIQIIFNWGAASGLFYGCIRFYYIVTRVHPDYDVINPIRRINIKKVFSLLSSIVLVCCFLLTGCSGKTPKELKIAWWGSQNRHDRTIKVIELYMEKNPNVKITYEFAGWNDYWTKMTTMAAGKNLPDVMQHDYSRLTEWQSRNLVVPLDEYVSRKVIDFTDVADTAIAGGRINGQLYGVSLGMNSQCFIIDLDAFEKAGAAIPPQDWTWDDFEQISIELTKKLGIFGFNANLLNETIWQSIYLANGEWSYAPDGKSIGYASDDLFIEHLKRYKRLVAAGAYPNRELEAEATGTGIEDNYLVTQKAAMGYMWSNQLTALAAAAGPGRRFEMVHIPRLKRGGKAGQYLKPSMFFSLTSQAKNPDEGAEFINFVTNDLEANKILMGERGVPISSAIRELLLSFRLTFEALFVIFLLYFRMINL